jgi:hypothetical protein
MSDEIVFAIIPLFAIVFGSATIIGAIWLGMKSSDAPYRDDDRTSEPGARQVRHVVGVRRVRLERFDLVPALPGGAMATAVLVAAAGGLMAFAIFAVAVHSVLAEL